MYVICCCWRALLLMGLVPFLCVICARLSICCLDKGFAKVLQGIADWCNMFASCFGPTSSRTLTGCLVYCSIILEDQYNFVSVVLHFRQAVCSDQPFHRNSIITYLCILQKRTKSFPPLQFTCIYYFNYFNLELFP